MFKAPEYGITEIKNFIQFAVKPQIGSKVLVITSFGSDIYNLFTIGCKFTKSEMILTDEKDRTPQGVLDSLSYGDSHYDLVFIDHFIEYISPEVARDVISRVKTIANFLMVRTSYSYVYYGSDRDNGVLMVQDDLNSDRFKERYGDQFQEIYKYSFFRSTSNRGVAVWAWSDRDAISDPELKKVIADSRFLSNPPPEFKEWISGVESEYKYWDEFLRDKKAHSEGEISQYEDRMSWSLELSPRLGELLGSGDSILDVGSGPLTTVGRTYHGRKINVVATDPLAEIYKYLFKKHGITPPVVPIECPGERVHTLSLPRFDIVQAQNSLDHSHNPIDCIVSMMSCIKPDGCVYLLHHVDVAKEARYLGFHKWNMNMNSDGDFIIYNKTQEINFTRSYFLEYVVETKKFDIDGYPYVEVVIRFKK